MVLENVLLLITLALTIIGVAFFATMVGIIDPEEKLKRRELWLRTHRTHKKADEPPSNEEEDD